MSDAAPAEAGAVRNAAAPWDSFGSDSYYRYNYASIREDDRKIAIVARDFFANAKIAPNSVGLDIGTGPNLVPALAMLPFASNIVLYEYSASNVDWLKQQRAARWPVWDSGLSRFWDVYKGHSAYGVLGSDPRERLYERTSIIQGDLFSMDPALIGTFDLGTMFFVAESISDHPEECQSAIVSFLDALKPGAPFVAAFMESSTGYIVDHMRFPATAVGVADVESTLSRRAEDVRVERIASPGVLLRNGYEGMLVATGRIAGAIG